YQVQMMRLEIYMNLHENEQFMTLYHTIKDEIEVHGEPIDRINMSLFVGHYFMLNMKDYDEALPHYQKALSLAIEFCNPKVISIAMNNIAVILYEKNEKPSTILQFLEFYMTHIENLGGINDLTYIEAHGMYFRTLISMKQLEKVQSKINYLLTFNVSPFVHLKLYYYLALCQFEGEEYAQSLETCEKMLEILRENTSLHDLLYIYLEVYDIMMRIATVQNSPRYAQYEKQYEEILEKEQARIQQHLTKVMDFYEALPYYEPNENFYRKMNQEVGTFFVLNTNDIQQILSKISGKYTFMWTIFTSSYGIYIHEELTEKELSTLLIPLEKYENYTFCHFKSNKDTPKNCYVHMQATLYYQEHLSMNMF
ncbi:MAG: hypothetical protein ACI33M_15445, partial [Lysinibacillus sp.]